MTIGVQPSLDERAVTALERIAENFPPLECLIFFYGDTDTVAAGSSLTVIFRLNWRHWALKIKQLYADPRTDCDYEWWFAGEYYTYNDVDLPFPRKAIEDSYHEIKLKITNTGASAQEVSYNLNGWAIRKV